MLGTEFCDVAHLHPQEEDQKRFILEIKGMPPFRLGHLRLCKAVKQRMYQFDIVGECGFAIRRLLVKWVASTSGDFYRLCQLVFMHTPQSNCQSA